MRSLCSGAFLAFVLGTAVFGQQTPAPSTSPSSPSQPSPAVVAGSQAGEQITLTGCVQRESDYRRTHEAGRGGVGGTGVGAANEFVLADATMSSKPTGQSPAAPAPSPTGTTGASAAGTMAYELTGPNEGKVAQFVGRRVEIMGHLKPAAVGSAGATGGPTAGAPPRGVDITSKDLQLRELEITSVREASGTCAPTPAK